MRLLITGGNGCAGHYLSSYFAEKGHNVTATYRNKINEPISNVEYVKQELSEPINIEGNYDAIIHTAVSKSGIELSIDEYVRDNVETAQNLVEYARRKGIKTIVYFSTRSIYGEIGKKEIYEEDDIINPGKYGLTKRIAELIFMEAADINTIGLRIPNIIGPGAHDIWLTKITKRIQNDEDIEVSDFDTKNLASIKDISVFIEYLITNGSKKFKYNIINISCSETINNVCIAEHIKKRLNSNSLITVIPPTQGLFWLNSSKAVEMGFRSSSPLEIIDGYIDSLLGREITIR